MERSLGDLIEPDTPCPVPPEQRPLHEYEELRRSWFFRWPAGGSPDLARALLISWGLALPASLVIASGSFVLRQEPSRMVILAADAALLLPLLLLARQWLGWSYVRARLVSERVEYEESGWYDGQIWEKPLSWRQRDLLVARHQVAPVLRRLRGGVTSVTLLMLAGAGLCQAL